MFLHFTLKKLKKGLCKAKFAKFACVKDKQYFISASRWIGGFTPATCLLRLPAPKKVLGGVRNPCSYYLQMIH